MALCGDGAICIWNDITPETEADFYAWHNEEHMPERVGIPGFLRGRRYRAVTDDTTPAFFTLYETSSPEVTFGQDYLGRLNNPTPWTQRVTKEFRNTFRALTRVRSSFGPGSGGAIVTLRMSMPEGQREAFEREASVELLPKLARASMIVGVHLCMTNMEASADRTTETRGRDDLMEPPNTAILIEGCTTDASIAAADDLLQHDIMQTAGNLVRGVYFLEYTRLKSSHAVG